jgi:shikimate dehydrogenase
MQMPVPQSRDQYAVFGNPIAHSKSPTIHMAFALETGQPISYVTELAPLDGFAQCVADFIERGGRGFNVTVPFKEEAWALVDERSPRAELAGAVNTVLVQSNGRLFGENTDGVGLVRDLTHNHEVELAGRSILMLGAGGAARGAVGPLLSEGPSRLVIANRTIERARVLANDFRTYASVVPSYAEYADLSAHQPFDVIINATAAGLSGDVPPVPLTALVLRGCCYDMVYADVATPFQRWARAAGADVALDGLGMLAEQAAEAFRVWRGVLPPTAGVIAELRIR